MLIERRHVNGLVICFFLIVIAIVFQQIATSMTEQGIASGSPYDNAAAYPRAVALIIAALLALEWLVSRWRRRSSAPPADIHIELDTLLKPALLLVIFAVYLGVLGVLGYHLSTTPMILLIMWLCGVRHPGVLLAGSLGIAFVLAFLFEYFLNIVLPGGVFALNIPW